MPGDENLAIPKLVLDSTPTQEQIKQMVEALSEPEIWHEIRVPMVTVIRNPGIIEWLNDWMREHAQRFDVYYELYRVCYRVRWLLKDGEPRQLLMGVVPFSASEIDDVPTTKEENSMANVPQLLEYKIVDEDERLLCLVHATGHEERTDGLYLLSGVMPDDLSVLSSFAGQPRFILIGRRKLRLSGARL